MSSRPDTCFAPGERALLLASGGLDSTTLAFWLASCDVHVTPLFVDYGQHCAAAELESLRAVLPREIGSRLQVVEMSDVWRGSRSRLIDEANLWEDAVNSDDLYVPYRNLLLLGVGAATATTLQCTHVCAAFINSNHALEIDCTAEFFGRLGSLLSEYGDVRLTMPFRDLGKRDVVELAIELGVPLGTTYSCQVSSRVPCGACPNCVEREDALEGS